MAWVYLIVKAMMRNGMVWELDPTEFADGMTVRCEQNRRVKNDTQYLV